MKRWVGLGWWGFLTLWALAAQGQQVDLLTPTREPFKEKVRLQATLGEEREGYVIFYIDGKFRTATSYPYVYEWDTKQERDGEHKILLIGHASDGSAIGEKEFTVQVENVLAASKLPPEGILLRWKLRPEEERHYHMRAEGTASIVEGAVLLGNLRELRIRTEAWWQDRVLFITPDGQITVRRKIKNGYIEVAAARYQVRGVAQGFSLLMDSRGSVRPRRQVGYYGYGDISLVFPEHPVKLGESWQSDIRIIPEVETQEPVVLKGTHVLEAIEWVEGYRCARIRSTYKGAVEFNLNIGGRLLPVKAKTEGTRITYFAFEEGKFIRAEDEATHQAEIEAAQLGLGAAGMGGMGLPQAGGFGGPLGLPGMEFGQPGGMPGAMPGAAPYAAGVGAGGPGGAMPWGGPIGAPYGGGVPGVSGPLPFGAGMGGGYTPQLGIPPLAGGLIGDQMSTAAFQSVLERPSSSPPITRQQPGVGGAPPYGGGAPPYGGVPYGAGGMPPYGAGGTPPYGAGAMPPYGGEVAPGIPSYGAGAIPPYGAGGMPPYGAGAMPPYGGAAPYGTGAMPPYGYGSEVIPPGMPGGPGSELEGMPAYPGGPGFPGTPYPGVGGGMAAPPVPQKIRVQYRVRLLVELEEGDRIGPPQPKEQQVAEAGRRR